MAIGWLLPVRAVQALFALIVMAIAASVVADLDGFIGVGDFKSRFAFNVFAGVWTLFTEIYLIGILFYFADTSFGHPLFSLVIDFLNWVFWVAAFGAVAALIDGFTNTGKAGAVVAFGVLNWLLFSVTLGFAVFAFLKGRGGRATKTTEPGA